MTSQYNQDYLVSLLSELCALPRETERVEFKVNDAEPQAIGEYISALANSAALVGTAFASGLWLHRGGARVSRVLDGYLIQRGAVAGKGLATVLFIYT